MKGSLIRFLLNLILVAVLAIQYTASASAQVNGWAAQQHIPGYLPDTLPPYLFADQNRTVHAFASQGRDTGDTSKAIVYSRWRADIGWSNPIDILLSPIKEQARVMDAYLDGQGIIHLIFFGGDDGDASIFYSYAPAALAGSARAWAEPLEIGPEAITPNVAGMVSDGKGRFVMVYSGNLQDGNSLYSVRSTDNGETWSEPELIYSTYNLKDKVFDFDLYLGESGTLHVVWNVTNAQGQNITGLYAQLEEIEAGSWSDPSPLDKNIGLGIAIPAVIEYKSEVMILYNNGLDEQTAPVHWMIRSQDNGKSWSRPVRPFVNHIGRNGHFSFVTDGDQRLYVFFGQRIPGGVDGKLDLHGMWYSSWKGGQWDGVRAVVSGEYRDEVTNSFDPYDASAVISQGNEVLVTWRTDPGRRQPNVWFSSRKLEASELPVVPLSLVEPTATLTPVLSIATVTEVAAIATVTVTPKPALSTETPQSAVPKDEAGPGQVLLIGLIPVGLILMLTALWQSRRKRHF